jgi:hypothetical protein
VHFNSTCVSIGLIGKSKNLHWLKINYLKNKKLWIKFNHFRYPNEQRWLFVLAYEYIHFLFAFFYATLWFLFTKNGQKRFGKHFFQIGLKFVKLVKIRPTQLTPSYKTPDNDWGGEPNLHPVKPVSPDLGSRNEYCILKTLTLDNYRPFKRISFQEILLVYSIK